MNTLTKEWLMKTIAELEEERDATPGAVNEDAAMALAAMKLALAMLEAEPVAWRSLYYENHGLLTGSKNVLASWQKQGWECEPLYIAPPALDSSQKNAESASSNSPLIPDCGEHGFCQKHPDTRLLTHPYVKLMTYPSRPSVYCPKCDPNVTERVEMDKKLRQGKFGDERPYTVVMQAACQHEWVHHVPCSRLKPEYEECYKCGARRPYPAAPQQEVS
ncbi:hypothetical protein [Enterobacter bugandensis]|uniref:hypothetical protein n=1 Tax=Enterobacter bugandensis TaxID=881260 RepID=UPI00300CD208